MRSSRFTLVELLIVIGIIAILAGILLPVISGAAKRADMTKAKAEITTLINAIKQFESTYGHLPLPKNYTEGSYFSRKDDDPSHIEYRDLILMLQAEPITLGGSDYDYPSFDGSNPNTRKTRFLDVVKNKPGEFKDPWGKDYYVHLDKDYDGKITGASIENGSGSFASPLYYSIVIWSKGANLGTTAKAIQNDNVYSFPVIWDRDSDSYKISN